MNSKRIILKVLGGLLILLIFNEFIIYYTTLIQCKWPATYSKDHVKAIILADIHMLGPFKGHWADKLRREWQMHRTFQSSVTLFRPDVVFILGDLFDEGQWVNDVQFDEYLIRYRRLFHTDERTRVFGAIGNHDIGFHYRISSPSLNRFQNVFNNTDDTLLVTVKGVHFVIINSMAMEQDGCNFCKSAERKIENISRILNCARGLGDCEHSISIGEYSRPILLQHFPTYRSSDSLCSETDTEEIEEFREHWEVLSKESTKLLGKMLEPRVAFSGHSHNYCRLKNMLNIEEYTISSYSWRNKNNPKFLLAQFTPTDYNAAACDMPKESTIFTIYTIGAIVTLLVAFCTEYTSRPYRSVVRKKEI